MLRAFIHAIVPRGFHGLSFCVNKLGKKNLFFYLLLQISNKKTDKNSLSWDNESFYPGILKRRSMTPLSLNFLSHLTLMNDFLKRNRSSFKSPSEFAINSFLNPRKFSNQIFFKSAVATNTKNAVQNFLKEQEEENLLRLDTIIEATFDDFTNVNRIFFPLECFLHSENSCLHSRSDQSWICQ